MKTILIVGIGSGNPEHLTVQAINALNRADVLFIPDKGAGKADLAELRRDIVARYVTNPASRMVTYGVPRRDAANPDYGAGVDDWHAALAAIFRGLLDQVPDNGAGAFLVWGDPGLYDSTIRIVERLRADHTIEIIPGISAIQALTAAHGIALNRIGEPVHIRPPSAMPIPISTSSGAPISARRTRSPSRVDWAMCATRSWPPAGLLGNSMAGSWTRTCCASGDKSGAHPPPGGEGREIGLSVC